MYKLSQVKELNSFPDVAFTNTIYFQLTPPNVFLSHDWPNTIERHGNTADLLRRKPFFKKETENGVLGSPPLLDLLKTIKPRYWFSAHLHTRFEALYKHGSSAANQTAAPGNPDEIMIEDDIDDVDDDERAVPATNPDEIKMDEGEDESIQSETKVPAAQASIENSTQTRETHFLALDKCLPKRHFLEVCVYRKHIILFCFKYSHSGYRYSRPKGSTFASINI